MTAIHVTHDHDEAASVADRVALMDQGRIHRVGSYDALRAQPIDASTATFLGLETLWIATTDAEGIAPTPLGPLRTDRPGQTDVAVLLRPENVRAGPATPDWPNGEVALALHTASGWRIRVELDQGGHIAALTPQRTAEGQRLAIDPDSLAAAELLEPS